MSNANSIDVPKDGTATIGHKAILTTFIDGESWPDAIHQVVEYSQSIGIHPYLQNDIVLRSISNLERDRPVKSTFLRSQLDKQSKAEEKILSETMRTRAGRDPLYIYSLLIKSNPASSNFDYTNTDSNRLASHSADDANTWRSTKVYVADYAVYKHLSGMGYKLETPPSPDDIKLIAAHLPFRYFCQWSEGGSANDRLIARDLLSVDSTEADALISAEVKAINDHSRYSAAVPATWDTPASPGDTDAQIIVKLTDASTSLNSFNALLKVHEESVSSCLKQHACVKKFVDEVIPIANHLCKELVTDQRWGAILPFIERHFTQNAQFTITSTALPTYDGVGGVQSFKHVFKNFLSKVQVLEQERDSSMRENLNKLTFAKALDAVLLLDAEWKIKYPDGPDKVTRDHKIREHMRAIFHGTDFDPVLNNLLQRKSEANHRRIFGEFEHHERLHPRPPSSCRKVTIHTVSTTSKRAREDLPAGESFCVLHSATGETVFHDTKSCRAVKNGNTKPDPDGSGWHVYKNNGLRHVAYDASNAKNGSKKPKVDNASKGGLKGGADGGGKGSGKGSGKGGAKGGGKGNPKGGKPQYKSLREQNEDLHKQVSLLQSGSGADNPACSVCFKAYQSKQATLADVSSHHTNAHAKWKKGRSEVNAVEFAEFKTQLSDIAATIGKVNDHVHTL